MPGPFSFGTPTHGGEEYLPRSKDEGRVPLTAGIWQPHR
jgi:hypothetical protein